MTRIGKIMAGALATVGIATGVTLATSAPADARVAVGIGIGIPAPGYYYGPGYYPPGPCYGYDYYYSGYCGYPTYGGAVFIGGRWVYGPHYYRWWGGRPWFWHRGGWHNWGGWRGAHFACNLRAGGLTSSSPAQPGDLVSRDLELYLAADCDRYREYSDQHLHL